MTRLSRHAAPAGARPFGALEFGCAVKRLLNLGGSLVPRLPVLFCAGTGWCCGPAITAPTVETITLEPSVFTLDVGQTGRVFAIAKDQAGDQVVAVVFTWSSSATAVAIVDESGQVAALSEGTATISAATGGRVGAATVTVVRNPAGAQATSRPTHLEPKS